MNKISEEINELLQEKGSVSIAELTNNYELPSEFIQQASFFFLIEQTRMFSLILIAFTKNN